MSKKYKTFKVFDCQDMPPKIKTKFFSRYNKCNDVFVKHYVYDPCQYATKEEFEKLDKSNMSFIHPNEDGSFNYEVKGESPISDWLAENGANPFEEVLINHWW